ncbi:hypothetical protein Ddye_013108 [Dipteronia dyeriana]|uniref:Uncharacterized protein n=1 Tax=Dipteronia dyeriana TaxID=168575 RepID=A0AAD9X5S9_9ROSI|nr:hypothetical protein Ddye_013108 [Dipteronia dyeriana]
MGRLPLLWMKWLQVDGEAVLRDITCAGTTNVEICENLLGKAPNSDAKEIKCGMVRHSWLKENFSECPDDALDEEMELSWFKLYRFLVRKMCLN